MELTQLGSFLVSLYVWKGEPTRNRVNDHRMASGTVKLCLLLSLLAAWWLQAM